MADLTYGHWSTAAQRAVNTLELLGLPAFEQRYQARERPTMEDRLLWIGPMAVRTTSLVAAILTLAAESAEPHSPPSATPRGTDRFLSEHGVDPHALTRSGPPKVGDQFLNRTDIQRVHGGNGVTGITSFRDDVVVNCFSDDETGSYADDRPTSFGPFGYRGEGRKGDQKIARGNRLLETARETRSAIRYWHKPLGGPFTFMFWCAVVGRRWDHGIDDNKQSRREIVWILHRLDDPRNVVIPDHIREMGDGETDNMDAEQGPEPDEHRSYLKLRNRATARPPGETHREFLRREPIRNRAARDAVLVRAANMCEAPWCNGMPPDDLESGAAILEVDHVKDLARGGPDEPSNMVALCPNCHAAKTRGRDAKKARRRLREIARRKDREQVATESAGMGPPPA